MQNDEDLASRATCLHHSAAIFLLLASPLHLRLLQLLQLNVLELHLHGRAGVKLRELRVSWNALTPDVKNAFAPRVTVHYAH